MSASNRSRMSCIATYPLPLRAKSARNVYMIHDLGSFFACSESGGRQLAGGAGTVGVPADGSRSGIRCEDHPRACSHCRIAIAALSVGAAQGCVDECLRYSRERAAFGHTIGSYQAIQFTLADMEARTHTARLAYYHAASRMLRGDPFKKEAAIAKLVSSNAAMDNARAATQIFGGYGFMNEFPVGRFYRDAKILEIGEGTSEVQRMLIARQLGL